MSTHTIHSLNIAIGDNGRIVKGGNTLQVGVDMLTVLFSIEEIIIFAFYEINKRAQQRKKQVGHEHVFMCR